MSTLKILHNPRCSKSRQTLELLKQNGHNPDVIEYLKTPLNAQQLEDVMNKLGIDDPRLMMRVKESEYVENDLGKDSQTVSSLLDAITRFPKVLERPIVITEKAARIGRPPESVLEIL